MYEIFFRPRIAAKRKSKTEEESNDVRSGSDKKPRKKRSPPPGYIPFKQIVIPEHWKRFPDSKLIYLCQF